LVNRKLKIFSRQQGSLFVEMVLRKVIHFSRSRSNSFTSDVSLKLLSFSIALAKLELVGLRGFTAQILIVLTTELAWGAAGAAAFEFASTFRTLTTKVENSCSVMLPVRIKELYFVYSSFPKRFSTLAGSSEIVADPNRFRILERVPKMFQLLSSSALIAS